MSAATLPGVADAAAEALRVVWQRTTDTYKTSTISDCSCTCQILSKSIDTGPHVGNRARSRTADHFQHPFAVCGPVLGGQQQCSKACMHAISETELRNHAHCLCQSFRRTAQLALVTRTAQRCSKMRCTRFHSQYLTKNPSCCWFSTTSPSRHTRSRCKRANKCHAPPTRATADVFALDFDGVLVDSEPEISSSAIAAASEYWPEEFGHLDDAANHQVRHNLRQVRPVLVNGVEALVMVQKLLCFCTGFYDHYNQCNITVALLMFHSIFSQARMVLEDPSCTDSIIHDWQSLLPATLKQWGVEQKDLQSFFEDFRNNLLQNHEVSHHMVLKNIAISGVFHCLAHVCRTNG